MRPYFFQYQLKCCEVRKDDDDDDDDDDDEDEMMMMMIIGFKSCG